MCSKTYLKMLHNGKFTHLKSLLKSISVKKKAIWKSSIFSNIDFKMNILHINISKMFKNNIHLLVINVIKCSIRQKHLERM